MSQKQPYQLIIDAFRKNLSRSYGIL